MISKSEEAEQNAYNKKRDNIRPNDAAYVPHATQATCMSANTSHFDNIGIGGAPTRATTLPTDSEGRKQHPVASGVLDYFPDAIVAISEVSKRGNDQHNPGQPLHWNRGKSGDEADTMQRHFLQRGTRDTDGVRHSAKMAWRALALLQKEIEAEKVQRQNTPLYASEALPLGLFGAGAGAANPAAVSHTCPIDTMPCACNPDNYKTCCELAAHREAKRKQDAAKVHTQQTQVARERAEDAQDKRQAELEQDCAFIVVLGRERY